MSNIDVTEQVYVRGSREFSRKLAVLAARASSEKKATEPVVMDLGDLVGLTDYFVICSASNDRQVKAIVDEIEELVFNEVNVKPRAIEGLHDATWVLMDYGDIVVHVMGDEARAFYSLERLWSDAVVVDWRAVA